MWGCLAEIPTSGTAPVGLELALGAGLTASPVQLVLGPVSPAQEDGWKSWGLLSPWRLARACSYDGGKVLALGEGKSGAQTFFQLLLVSPLLMWSKPVTWLCFKGWRNKLPLDGRNPV